MTQHAVTKSVLALLLGATTVSAQEQPNLLFNIPADGPLEWFASDNNTRGLAVIPNGNLLVADRGAVNTVYILDHETGRQVGNLDMTGVEGGTFPLNKVVVARDGAIYACNLAAATSVFRIYYWADIQARPVVLFELPNSPLRWGVDLSVTGIGGSTRFLVSASDNTNLLVVEDRNGDGIFESRQLPLDPEPFGIVQVEWDPSHHYLWVRQATAASAQARRHDVRTGKSTDESGGIGAMSGPFTVARDPAGETLLLTGPGFYPADGAQVNVDWTVQKPGSLNPIQISGRMNPDGAPKPNINGAGDIVVDPWRNTVYILWTNNSISGWKLPVGVVAPR